MEEFFLFETENKNNNDKNIIEQKKNDDEFKNIIEQKKDEKKNNIEQIENRITDEDIDKILTMIDENTSTSSDELNEDTNQNNISPFFVEEYSIHLPVDELETNGNITFKEIFKLLIDTIKPIHEKFNI